MAVGFLHNYWSALNFVNMPEPLKYLQFIGTQRSGTNLLRVMLNQLPAISAPHPPHILKTFVPLLNRYGNLAISDNINRLAEDVCDWINANPVPWSPYIAQPAQAISESRSPDLLGIFVALSEAKARLDQAQWWCCKSMESVAYTDLIEAAGLKPVYIHLYRDGRDVALSFMKAVVGPKHLYHLAQKWREDQEQALRLRPLVPEPRFISLRYEDLIATPEPILKSLCATLQLDFRPEMLNYFESSESKNTSKAGKMWENLQKPVLSGNKQKFLSEMSRDDLALFEAIAGGMLTRLGYELFTSKSERILPDIEQIKIFDAENKRRMLEVGKTADQADLERRRPQEELLKKILSRPIID